MTYASWQRGDQRSAVHNTSTTVDELRAGTLFRLMTPEECIAFAKETPILVFHPLCGGIDPDLAWSSLRFFEEAVLPRL
jgi:hypothetical protein